MLKLRTMTASELAHQHNQLASQFKDNRLTEMLFRYRARNFQSSLNANELNRWQQYCRKKCLNSDEMSDSHALNLFSCRAAIQQERSQNTDSQSLKILDALEHWLTTLEQWGAPKTG
ncbi:MAG: hypothetical protein Q8L06_07005, partial [Pseudohongiella sp.]|nr:hypothetical protein [Pseudohongiella sp.]